MDNKFFVFSEFFSPRNYNEKTRIVKIGEPFEGSNW